MESYFNVGKIVSTHGIKGEVKVYPLTDDPSRFEELKSVIVEKNGNQSIMNINSIKYVKNSVVLKFNEINDMESAIALKDAMLIINRKDAIKLPKDKFFICDILGCDVFDGKRGYLGKIDDILPTGSNDVYIVKGSPKYKEVLIPALKSVVKNVDLENKRIDVELLEGLLDD